MQKIISGKVREVYEVSDKELVIVTTDRISAFDVILPTLIPDKGKVLTAIANMWFDYTKDIVPNHIISSNLADMDEFFQKDEFEGRTIKVKKLKMLPYEFIVRGYIFGNMWEAYKKGEEFCGNKIVGNYQMAEKLAEPIITPSTKATEGHDIYVSFDHVVNGLGEKLANQVKDVCIKLYNKCYQKAYENGIILADTKFEFGLDENGNLVIGDEMFTPDSSRFWSLEEYKIGSSPKSYDKQFLRDWLINNKLNGVTPAPQIPEDIVNSTEKVYKDCLAKLVK